MDSDTHEGIIIALFKIVKILAQLFNLLKSNLFILCIKIMLITILFIFSTKDKLFYYIKV